ncbi:hypothetical protein OIU77_021967 [Salix suchowensis]|uniref:Uncharacterized protein n=1 Tax=Salix suchowensis TaxID=1278906 RepID=A0ABQ9CDL5_9ROSI|nr:hypothetical protein OIU77_021967 [Salix suchowensis]
MNLGIQAGQSNWWQAEQYRVHHRNVPIILNLPCLNSCMQMATKHVVKEEVAFFHSKLHTEVSLIAAKQIEIAYSSVGKQMARGPAAIHLSFQNRIVSPIPTV